MPRGRPSKNSKQQAAAKSKDREALELRKAGATYQQIADKLGISLSGAGLCVSRAMDALRLEVSEQAEAVRQIELDRLDAMLLGLWEKARRGDPAAIDRVLRIQERRAKYLGLDAPTRTDVRAEVVARQDLSHLDDDRLAQIERLLGADPDAS